MKNRVFMIYNNNHTVQIRHIVPLQLQTIFSPLLFVFILEHENNSFECEKKYVRLRFKLRFAIRAYVLGLMYKVRMIDSLIGFKF